MGIRLSLDWTENRDWLSGLSTRLSFISAVTLKDCKSDNHSGSFCGFFCWLKILLEWQVCQLTFCRRMYNMGRSFEVAKLFVAFLFVGTVPFVAPQTVIVIGGGVAGLNAAATLDRAGFNVTLFEAMGRVGGRTYTLKLPDGQFMDMGGEWIHGEKNNSVFELVNPLGLVDNSIRQPLEYGDYFALPTGEVLNETLAEKLHALVDNIWFDTNGWGEDVDVDMNLGEWGRYVLERFQEEIGLHTDPVFLEAVYDWAHRLSIAEESSANWFQVSSSDEGEQYIWLEGNANVRWKPPYSYASLHQLILTGTVTEDGVYPLPGWINLNTEVTGIEYSTSGHTVTVVTRDGGRHSADHVVFTPSLGVLKATHTSMFTPPLPAKQQLAIESLGFGSVAKICLQFRQPWWPTSYEGLFPIWNDVDHSNSSIQWWRDDITKEELLVEDAEGVPVWTRAILSFHNVDSGSAPDIFRVWLGGVPARILDELDPSYVQQKVMLLIHKFLDATFPGEITEPVRMYQTVWYSNVFTRGAYSFRTPESDANDVWARDLGEPILHNGNGKPLVCFAGEATHPFYYATVHGAYDSGMREAQRILSFYAGSSPN